MNDKRKAELRRLAEDMPDLDWDSQFEDNEQTGFCCLYAKPFELDGEMHDGPTFVERCHPEQAKFIAEGKENVLSLLDENKRIANRLCACRDCGGQGEVYSGHDEYQGHFQPPEPVMDVCGTCGGDGVLGTLEDFESLAEERDQLRADAEALRKDAGRYRWLRARLPGSAYRIAGVIYSEGGNSVDAVIDAAMVKEVGANG